MWAKFLFWKNYSATDCCGEGSICIEFQKSIEKGNQKKVGLFQFLTKQQKNLVWNFMLLVTI